jgi:hypothetical protein
MRVRIIVSILLCLFAASGCATLRNVVGIPAPVDNTLASWASMSPQQKSTAMAQQFFIFEGSYEALLKTPQPTAEQKKLMNVEYKILKGMKATILGYEDAIVANDPMKLAEFELQFLQAVNNWLLSQLSK